MCSAPCAPSMAPTVSVACGCRCTAAGSSALPVGPGAIWRRRVRSGVRSSSARQPCSGLQPAGSASHTAASRHRGFPGNQPAATRKTATDPSTPRAPALARPDLAQQLAAFQAALPGSRGEAYLQQRGIPLALAQQLRRWLCGAGHLAACRPGLARRPCGLSPYHAGGAAGEPLRACGWDSRAGPQSEAPRPSARGERLLQRRRAAGRCRTAVGVRGRL